MGGPGIKPRSAVFEANALLDVLLLHPLASKFFRGGWEPGHCLACLSLSTTARLGFDPQNPTTLPSISRSDSGSPDPYNGGLGRLRARIAPSYPAQALEPPAYWRCVSWSDPQLHRHTRALLRRPKPKSKYLYVLWGARSTAVSKTAA